MGKCLSGETKKKISEAGKKVIHTKEWNRKVGLSHIGMKHSEESKKKMSEVKKGGTLSEEHKKKIGIAITGDKNPFFGRHHSEKTKERLRRISAKRKHSKKTRRMLSEMFKGEKAPNYKGGITPINDKIRKGVEIRLWREAVFARDNWICRRCWKRSGNGEMVHLRAHHIRNFSEFKELRTSIENGITLCKECHLLFHKIYGFRNNTKKQLKEFLCL